MSSPQNSPDLRNLMLAIFLSIAVLMGWQLLDAEPQREAALKQEQQAKEQAIKDGVIPPDLPAEARTAPAPSVTRQERLKASARIPIQSPSLTGSINLRGLRIDDVTLKNYNMTVDEDSPPVTLLSPAGGKDSYFAEFGWLSGANTMALPEANTQWQTQDRELGDGQSVRAFWENGQGVRFERTISLDDNYMFTVEQRVVNTTGEALTLYPYGLISRNFDDTGEHFFILHEGPLGVFNQGLEEVSYSSLRDDGQIDFKQSKGWLGITDKYWLAALVPDKNLTFNAKMTYRNEQNRNLYQVDYTGAGVTIAAGETASMTHRFFAGAKKVKLLDQYSLHYNIPLFDRAVDFGWLYFMTKPFFFALDFFNNYLGNFGLAIMALTICIKLLLFPLANKSYKAMSQLKLLMPKIQEIKERHGDDKMAMNQAIMKLYQEEKVNPASGCLPILIQIPIFFALYKVLFVTIEMRHADFYGWVNDLSAPDPTTVFNLFGLIPWDPPSFLMIGAWPLIMCGTMILQQKLNPKPNDPTQAMVMQWLPFIFLFLFASFPAGLVIYWAWNNSLSIAQQWVIMKRHGAR